MDLKSVEVMAGSLSARYHRFCGVFERFDEEVRNLEKEIKKEAHEVKILDSLIKIMDSFVDISNEETLGEVKSLINEGLLLAFPESKFSVDIVYKISRGSQTIDFRVLKNGNIEPLLDAQSGGVLDIVSFLLRIFIICRMNMQRFLFLDEALNGVSDLGDHASNASFLLKKICESRGFTVLLVTHKENLGKMANMSYLGEKCVEGDTEKIILQRV